MDVRDKKLPNNYTKAVAFMILSGACFGIGSLFIRLAGPEIPPLQKAFFRSLVVLSISLTILLKKKEPLKYELPLWLLLVLRSLVGIAGMMLNYLALDRIPIADASILLKLAPFFAIVFSFLVLKEKVTALQFAMIVAAIVGTVFVAHPWLETPIGNLEPQPLDYGIAILGAAAAGFAYTLVRKLGTSGLDKDFLVFFFAAFSVVVIAPKMLLDFYPMQIQQYIYLLFAGIFAAGGQYGMTYAYSLAPAKNISIFDYSQVVISAILSALVLGEFPHPVNYIGYVIIFLAAFTLFKVNQKAGEGRVYEGD